MYMSECGLLSLQQTKTTSNIRSKNDNICVLYVCTLTGLRYMAAEAAQTERVSQG